MSFANVFFPWHYDNSIFKSFLNLDIVSLNTRYNLSFLRALKMSEDPTKESKKLVSYAKYQGTWNRFNGGMND